MDSFVIFEYTFSLALLYRYVVSVVHRHVSFLCSIVCVYVQNFSFFFFLSLF